MLSQVLGPSLAHPRCYTHNQVLTDGQEVLVTLATVPVEMQEMA
jgi:hypothetical protein